MTQIDCIRPPYFDLTDGKAQPYRLARHAECQGEQHGPGLRPPPTGFESTIGAKASYVGGISSAFPQGAKAARRRKKLIKLQREIDVIDDAIADEQLLSPSLREQLAKERTSEDNASSSVDTAAEPMERVKARLTELSERLTGSAAVSKPGAR